MAEERTLLYVLISWFPMFMLIAMWAFFMFKLSGFRRVQTINNHHLEEHLKEVKRHNLAMESVLTKLEHHLSRLSGENRDTATT